MALKRNKKKSPVNRTEPRFGRNSVRGSLSSKNIVKTVNNDNNDNNNITIIIAKILIILNLLLLIFLTSCFLCKINRLPHIPYYSAWIQSIEDQQNLKKPTPPNNK